MRGPAGQHLATPLEPKGLRTLIMSTTTTTTTTTTTITTTTTTTLQRTELACSFFLVVQFFLQFPQPLEGELWPFF